MDDERARRIVASGYDTLAPRWTEWSNAAAGPSDLRLKSVAQIEERLSGGRVLEIGCGTGEPVARRLAERYDVTGIDLSPAQIDIANRAVPSATFLAGDILTADFAPASFDAVVSYFAITHVPRAHHAELLARIGEWLRPGGWFACSLGAGDLPDSIESDWLGVDMFFSHFDAATNERLLIEAGFQVERAEVLNVVEDGEPVPFLWILARRQPALEPRGG